MVSQHPRQQPDVMRVRLRPQVPPGQQPPPAVPQPGAGSYVPVPAPPPWRIEIPASDGTPLLVMREANGLLVVEGDESRWDEGAKRFLHSLMQWAGQAGITWKDEARRAGGRGE